MFRKSYAQVHHKIRRLRTATFSDIRAASVIMRQPAYITPWSFEAPFLSFLRKIMLKAVFFLCKGSPTVILSLGSVSRQASSSMVSNIVRTLWYRSYVGSSRLRLANALPLEWRNRLSSLKWLRVMTSAIGGYHSSTIQYMSYLGMWTMPILIRMPMYCSISFQFATKLDPTWTA